MNPHPAAIVIGGPPGAGKTTIATRLSAELGLPRLGSDTIGGFIEHSAGVKGGEIDAYWIAYDVIFGLCDDFLRSGVSAILDLNLGWDFQWRQLDELRARHPTATIAPIVLRCPRRICLARIQARHDGAPEHFAPPDRFLANAAIVAVWDYHDRLDRSDVQYVDASETLDLAYAEVKRQLPTLPGTLLARSAPDRDDSVSFEVRR